MRFAFIISLIFALFISIFAIQNAAAISINLLFAKINVSLALIIFISAGTGAIIAALLGVKRELKIKYENKQLLKRVHQLEQEKKQTETDVNKEKGDLGKN